MSIDAYELIQYLFGNQFEPWIAGEDVHFELDPKAAPQIEAKRYMANKRATKHRIKQQEIDKEKEQQMYSADIMAEKAKRNESILKDYKAGMMSKELCEKYNMKTSTMASVLNKMAPNREKAPGGFNRKSAGKPKPKAKNKPKEVPFFDEHTTPQTQTFIQPYQGKPIKTIIDELHSLVSMLKDLLG